MRAYEKVLHEQMVNKKFPEFLAYAKFGAEELNLDNKDDAFEIREPQDDEAVEKSAIMNLIKSRRELANDKLTKAKKDPDKGVIGLESKDFEEQYDQTLEMKNKFDKACA